LLGVFDVLYHYFESNNFEIVVVQNSKNSCIWEVFITI